MIAHHFLELFFGGAQVPPDFKLMYALLEFLLRNSSESHLVICRIAPLFFGVLLNVMLFGVFIVQVRDLFEIQWLLIQLLCRSTLILASAKGVCVATSLCFVSKVLPYSDTWIRYLVCFQ
jgi:hypothetical protein